jgi:prephenate dehydrogenase
VSALSVGVRITRLLLNKLPSAATTPFCSLPINDRIIICDVGSTKGSVIAIAKEVFGAMPPKFIPAHPIAGKEQNGVVVSVGSMNSHSSNLLL